MSRRTSVANAIGHSVRRYLTLPVESWTWPRRELQPAFDYCCADLAYFRRPLTA